MLPFKQKSKAAVAATEGAAVAGAHGEAANAAEPTLAAALASGGESLNASKPDLRAQLATSTAAVSEPSRSRLGASL